MPATTTCSCEDPCGCEESAFARLRYTYGQRLTAVDLLDEQAYLIGKDRFLARHVLGAGILCGLRTARGGGPPDRTPTIRVTRGAALDLCGRAIVVEHDQCLDVAAWYARWRASLPWKEPGTYTAWVGLRYTECPSDPVRVPGDPCGCDGDGCAYTRVHESFELALHAEGGPVEPARAPQAWSALCGTFAPGAPERCPACACEGWLLVTAVDVVLAEPAAGAGLRAVDVGPPRDDDARRLTLHSLAALQRLALGDCGPGPRVSGVAGDGALGGASIALALDDPLAPSTIDPSRFALMSVGANGWEEVAADVAYDADAAAFRVGAAGAVLDQPYRLRFVDDPERPIADEQLRPLRPERWSRTVRWVPGEAGAVTLLTTP